MNGKLTRQANKVKNNPSGSGGGGVAFYYGYKRQANPNRSRYGYRELARDLSKNPYTPAELAGVERFRVSVLAADEVLLDPARKSAARASYTSEGGNYLTLRGYIIATTYKNGGIPPW